VKACVVPGAIDALLGLIAIDCRTACPPAPPLAVEDELELPPPQLATNSKSVSITTSNNLRIVIHLRNGREYYTPSTPFPE